jgi:hypothetical protein
VLDLVAAVSGELQHDGTEHARRVERVPPVTGEEALA